MKETTILIVDDRPDNLAVMQSVVNHHLPGVQVLTAQDALTGISLARENKPDGILIDVQMSAMNGIDMCRELKADTETSHIPVVLITAHRAGSEVKVRGLEAGADDFISRPIDNEVFVARIKVMLRVSEAEKRLRWANKELETIIGEKSNKLALVLENTNEGLWDWNVETDEITFDRNLVSMLGVSSSERMFDFEWWKDNLHPDSLMVFEDAIADYMDGHTGSFEAEYRFKGRGGEWLWGWGRGICTSFDDRGKPLRITGTHRDVTLRKLAEEDRERLLHETSKRVSELRCMYGVEKLVRKRSTLEQLFAGTVSLVPSGWQYPEITCCRIRFDGKEFVSRVFEDTPWRQVATINVEEDACGTIEVFYVEERPGSDEGPFLKEERDLIAGVARALSEAVEHDHSDAVRERFMAAIDQAAEIIVITDLDAVIQYVNPAFEQVTGYTVDETIGQKPRILKSGEHDDVFYKDMWDALLRGETWKGRLINKKKDQTIYNEDAVISPVRDKSGEIVSYVAVKRDITKEIQQEEKICHSQKMEAIGTLAGGVAHDFNNVLAAILGYADLAYGAAGDNERVKKSVSQVIKAGKRAKKLVDQIAAFGRRKKEIQRIISVQPIAREVIKFLKGSLPSTIDVRDCISVNCSNVNADPTNIHQVIMNLCTNAYHAMEEQAKHPDSNRPPILTVALEERFPQFMECQQCPQLMSKAYVVLTVSDTGSGMPQSIVNRVFDPYFTTKSVGKGTGLGLSVVRSIVEQCHGHMYIKSQVGRGTEFRVFLPVSKKFAEDNTDEVNILPSLVKGTETIMLVDDEEFITSFMKQGLECYGYTVIAFNVPSQALLHFKKDPDAIDLVLTDLTMPELTGVELAGKMLECAPRKPIILVSGFSESYTEESVKSLGIEKLLYKPIRIKEMLVHVRRILDKRPDTSW